MLKKITNPYRKLFRVDSILLINLVFAFFPISFIFGNLIININITLFCILGIINLRSKILTTKFNLPIKIIFLFFIAILFSTCLSAIIEFNQVEKILTSADYNRGFTAGNASLNFLGSEHVNLEKIIKSILLFRYFLTLIIIYFLNKENVLNFKYFFISAAVSPVIVSLDIILQHSLGFNSIGMKSFVHHNTSFFGDEWIAGGYIQRFSFFSILLGFFILKNKGNLKFILTLIVICILGIGILLSGNRMPLILFLFGLMLLFLFNKNLNKIIPTSLLCFLIFFQIIVSNKPMFANSYLSLFDNIKDFVTAKSSVKAAAEIAAQKVQLKNEAAAKTQTDANEADKNNLNESSPVIEVKKNKFLLGDYMHHSRIFLAALDVWKKNKIFGNGIKSFRIDCYKLKTHALEPLDEFNLDYDFVKNKKNRLCSNHPHNYFFEILVESGIVGFSIIVLLGLFFIVFIFRNFKIFKENNIENLFLLAATISLFLEAFPFKSTGSAFTTSNLTYIILLASIILSYKKRIVISNE